MKSEILIYGYELLVLLDENENISFINLEKISTIKGRELRELLKYLKQKEYIIWKMPLFIGTLEKVDFIDDDKIRLAPKGMEVVIGKRDYFTEVETNINQTNIYNSQIAQTHGDNSPIIQINNSQINILKQLIENDTELNPDKKTKLFEILDKFNTLKESGQNAFELIKAVGAISIKYIPLFFSLLS